MRIKDTKTQLQNYYIDHQRENDLILNQILSTILKANVWGICICIWILGLKVLKTLSIAPAPGIEPMPSALQ